MGESQQHLPGGHAGDPTALLHEQISPQVWQQRPNLTRYFYEVKRRGGAQAEEKQSKTFITDIVMTQRETVPLHLNATQA